MCANDNAFRDVLPSLRCDVESLVFRRVASYEPFEGLVSFEIFLEPVGGRLTCGFN
jgi:hypothetical protein